MSKACLKKLTCSKGLYDLKHVKNMSVMDYMLQNMPKLC